jgi:hypothetical protein
MRQMEQFGEHIIPAFRRVGALLGRAALVRRRSFVAIIIRNCYIGIILR